MKIKPTRKNIERTIYLLIIIILVAYGFKDSEAAAVLINAVKEAFSILL
ncbi:MAG: hypothetical protein EZS26_001074 [Candidatus Ordinivivax streblomastigis]|uniref:Uncharacterized protein n=1 Tax=Candidatus Ordinivivax streblomastigis TaxID=2540710 RepID=A0A5M8P3D2_9BACT|nr:MAG: hypothetical protein EZS26_001074 [Candidatus Ordinivivax streblomastigis]